MNLILEDESGKELPFDKVQIAKDVMNGVLDYERCPYEALVSLVLTTNTIIQETNQQYRGVNRPTDVLSFPMLEYEKAGDFSFLEKKYEGYFHPETGELLLGDIMLSIEMLYKQAEEYQHSILREYAFLIAHSMLHLLGYDHMEVEEAVIMEKKQREILEILDILRV